MNFSKYFAAVDPNGNIVVLINSKDDVDCNILFSPIANPNGGVSVDVNEYSNNALSEKIGAQIVPISAEKYNETLFNDWGFDGSEIYRAQAEEKNADEENQNPNPPVEVPQAASEQLSTTDVEPATVNQEDAGSDGQSGNAATAEPILGVSSNNENDVAGLSEEKLSEGQTSLPVLSDTPAKAGI